MERASRKELDPKQARADALDGQAAKNDDVIDGGIDDDAARLGRQHAGDDASMEIDFVIVTAPNAPGSRTLISPFAAVLEIALAKVLHGAVRLKGLASSPTPDTHVRVG